MQQSQAGREIVFEDGFDGVFRLSNPFDEDFVVLWNNKEYTFPAHTQTPMIILGESPENVQEIRKRFAYKLAEREWFKSPEYQTMNAMDNLRGGRNDKVLQSLIDQCLSPLPAGKPIIRHGKEEVIPTKATKAVSDKEDLNAAFAEETRDGNIKVLGAQPDRLID